MNEQAERWNTAHEPRYMEIPICKLRSLLQRGLRSEAISEYSRLTGAGYIEAQAVIEEITTGAIIQPPCKYVGWRTGGEPIFWCRACQSSRKREQVRKEMRPDIYDGHIAYICSVCDGEMDEFHTGQAHRAHNLFRIFLKGSDMSQHTEWEDYKIFERVLQDFADGKMSPQVALEFEQALIDGWAFFEFLTQKGYLDRTAGKS